MKKQGYIYCITDTRNGKKYIGQTTKNDWKERVEIHLKVGGSGNPIIARIVKKYGRDIFRAECLRIGYTLEELNILENHLILQYDTFAPNGYNLTTGGDHYKHSLESRKKMSEALKGKPAWNKGKSPSVETRKKMSEAKKGKVGGHKGKKTFYRN